jgi:formate dehydrogenase alpha subunit
MSQVTLTIDGSKITAPAGTTIMQAAERLGIEIPRLCAHTRLPVIAACRVCVVEVEGAKTLVASCAYPVSEGMVVRTNTDRVRRARRMNLDLMLSDHRPDCLTCESCGACELQKYAYQYGVPATSFQGERNLDPVDRDNPFFTRDYQKCILCGRCIVACGEVQMARAIDYAHKGFHCRVATPFEVPLTESTCVFCGNCLQVCPTGALLEHRRLGQGRDWEMKETRTLCPYCGCGCSVILHTRGDRIIFVSGDSDSPVNRGWLCAKGRFGMEFVNSPDRLTKPLFREDGGWREASWEEALGYTAQRLLAIREKHGAEAIAVLASAKATNEENYLLNKLARAVIGTNNLDHCARLCHASTVAGLAAAFGSGAMTNSIEELGRADCLFVIGSNTPETHPIVSLPMKEAVVRGGARLLLADPRQIEWAEYAACWLRQRPGTDVALINALMHVILAEGLADREFIASRTEGFEELERTLPDYPPERAAEITGVPAEEIRRAARIFGQAERAAIIYAMGITQHTTGTDNVLALANLALLTGNLGKESAGVNPLRGQNNVQGACDMGALPGDLPGYQKVADPAAREKFGKAWGVVLPERPGLTLVEIFQAAEAGRIKGLFILGENPALTDPNVSHVRKALANLEFLAVADMFPTDTTEFAHVLLPACSFAEREGTFTNTERRVQLLRQAIPVLPGSRPDWQIICDLATRMGYPMSYQSPAEVFDEMAGLTPLYAGLSHQRLEPHGLQWPCPASDHPGTKFLHKERFTRGLGKFHAVPFRPAVELPDEEYPFVLTTGRILYHYHTGTMSRRSRALDQHRPRASVEINPADAEKLGCRSGDRLRLTSRRGEVEVEAEVTERTAPGVVFMSFHYREAAANLLTIDALDPKSKIPELKVCAVRVEVAGQPAREESAAAC